MKTDGKNMRRGSLRRFGGGRKTLASPSYDDREARFLYSPPKNSRDDYPRLSDANHRPVVDCWAI